MFFMPFPVLSPFRVTERFEGTGADPLLFAHDRNMPSMPVLPRHSGLPPETGVPLRFAIARSVAPEAGGRRDF